MSGDIKDKSGKESKWIDTQPVRKLYEDQTAIRNKKIESYGRKPTSSDKKQK